MRKNYLQTRKPQSAPVQPVPVDDTDFVELPQRPNESAKFYTAMRHRLLGMQLPSSFIAVFIAIHTICDADTGVFVRDDVTVREIINLPKSTVAYAFNGLLNAGLIAQTHDGRYIIVHYEEDRLHSQSYFRLTASLLRALPKMVAHHHPRIILFALELLDRGRHFNAELRYSFKHLIQHARLGSCRSRVLKALELLSGIVLWASVPNAAETDDLLNFYLVKDESSYSEDQERFRRLHGQISAETKRSYEYWRKRDTEGNLPPMTWRELARTTRILIKFATSNFLSDEEVLRMAGLFGTYCALNQVKRRVGYLRRALDDLLLNVRRMAS